MLTQTLLTVIIFATFQAQVTKQQQHQQLNPFAPTIIPFSFNQNQTVQENNKAYALCETASGETPVNFTWSKDGQLLTQQLAQLKRIQIKNDQDSSTLKITPVRLDHAGNYTCLARNRHGWQTYQAQLLVHGEPRWLREPPPHEPLVSQRGQTVVIDCQTIGWPKPQQSWQIKSKFILTHFYCFLFICIKIVHFYVFVVAGQFFFFLSLSLQVA